MKNTRKILLGLIFFCLLFMSNLISTITIGNTNTSDSSNSLEQTSTTSYGISTTTITTSPILFPSISDPIPFGKGSVDLEFVVDHVQTHSVGASPLNGQTGKMVFYKFDSFDLPDEQLLNSSPVDLSYTLINSNIFFKVIREDVNNLEIQSGFILGNDTFFSVKPDFYSSTAPLDILDLFIPKDLTLVIPIVGSMFKNPTNTTQYDELYNRGNLLPPGLSLFLDPTKWSNHSEFYDGLLGEFEQQAQTSTKSYINWYNINESLLPPNIHKDKAQYSSYLYETHLISQLNSANLSIPANYIYGAWKTSEFNPDADPTWVQNAQNYFAYNDNPNTAHFYNIPDGTDMTVVFYPDSEIHANNGVITLLETDFSAVYGVFSVKDYDYSETWQNQPGTDYYSGGSFAQHTITLGTIPQDDDELIVVYRPMEYPIITYAIDYIENSQFNITLQSALNTGIDTQRLSIIWDASGGSYSGWMKSLSFSMTGDFDNNNIYENWEKINIDLSIDPNKTTVSGLPISSGDQGIIKIQKSSLNIDLSPVYKTMFEKGGTTVASLENEVNNLQGTEIYDYLVTGVDGLYYGLSNQIGISDYYYYPDPPKVVVNGFDGGYNTNMTDYNQTLSYYGSNSYMSDRDILNLYKNTFTLPNAIYTDTYIVENVTLISTDRFSISLPADYYWEDSLFIFNGSEYNWSIDPEKQGNISDYHIQYSENAITYILQPEANFNIGDTIVVAYRPSKQMYAINGKVLLDVTPNTIYGVYSSCCPRQNYNPGSNMYTGGSYSENVITLGPSAPTGIYPVYVYLNFQQKDQAHLYSSGAPVYTTLIQFSFLGFSNPLIPARTPDWFIPENNVNFLNRIIDDNKDTFIDYLNTLIEDQLGLYMVEKHTLTLDINLGWTMDTLNVELSIDGNFDGYFPFSNLFPNLKLSSNTGIKFAGTLNSWIKWTQQGIFKELGAKIHLELDTTNLNPVTTTPHTTTSVNKISTTSGFAIIPLLILIPLGSLYLRRRRNSL